MSDFSAPHVLRTPDGEIVLGSLEESRAAMNDISDITGGSSGGGAWSYVFGVADGSRDMTSKQLARLAAEAIDLRATLDYRLSDRARAWLDKLSHLVAEPHWGDTPVFHGKPRDPERIDAILAAIGEIWHQHPDMRLTQLLLNLLDPRPNVLFYVEDTVVQERLREFVETGRWPASIKPD